MSTADPHRAPKKRPEGEGQVYKEPMGERKVVITQEELTDRSVQPVLKEGEALSDARTFPLTNAAGQPTGLDRAIIWLMHYWAQNDQGILIEIGDPNNVTEFEESEIFHSLCARIKKLGYDHQEVMSSDMPTGGRTGPWKTSVAGKVALELALDESMTVFPSEEDHREPQEFVIHVLNSKGFQIHAERQRRPAMTEAQKLAKRANRMVFYALLPAEMMNLRDTSYELRSP